MIKTILVPTSGGATDQNVFATALAVARLLGAHLEFYHLWISPGEAAPYMPHVAFVRGAAIADAFNSLQLMAETRASMAVRHFQDFCALNNVRISDAPDRSGTVSANWREDKDDALRHLMFRARHSDLIVMGRATAPDGLPRGTLETLLLGCGRPILIAPPSLLDHSIETVMVGWKETPEAARAVTAAMPILCQAKRVVLVSVDEGGGRGLAALEDVARQLKWHGIAAETEASAADGWPVAEQLMSIAEAIHADLLVMGGYGHSRTRETIFGGCTRSILDDAKLPVCLLN